MTRKKRGQVYLFIFLLNSIFCYFGFAVKLNAQTPPPAADHIADSLRMVDYRYYETQKDLIDIVYNVLHKDPRTRLDSTGIKNTKWYISPSPIVEYTIATGLTAGFDGNIAFTTSIKEPTNTSNSIWAIKYTEKKQFLLPVQSSIWTPGNRYYLLGDWRYLNYPQDTYGFGGYTKLTDQYIVDYKYLRLYELVLKNIGKDFYAGLGYQLDYHWGITESAIPGSGITDFQKYGFTKSSTSSAIAAAIVYDTRVNAINPVPGSAYASLQFSQNTSLLGANSNWNSLTIDLRRYIQLPYHTVLALWCYGVFVLDGNPPYLDLPATGSDTYQNTGRGYEQGRFLGKKMIDLEAELRFPLSKNGLFGGVVFCNAESLSELASNRFEVISPAIGIGLRIKFNKFSKTNIAFDYGYGTKGSKGFAGNLGEVF